MGCRDVVAGDEAAYSEIVKGVPFGRAGRPEEIAAAPLSDPCDPPGE